MITTKCLIIGSGPAGYTAGIYASRANLAPILFEGLTPGGQLTITNEVENFPGYPEGKAGPEIMEDLRNQAKRMGTDIRSGYIKKVDFSTRPFHCHTDNGEEIVAETVIISTGATARWLGIPSEEEFRGFGVSACATCDGFFFRDKEVAVVGGGDTALEDALYLSHLCQKVYLIHRRDQLRASQAMQKKIFATPNIEIKWNAVVDEILGEKQQFSKRVTGVSLLNTITNETSSLSIDGLFIAIGHTPVTELFKGQIELDENGYVKTIPGRTATSVPGVFAAGDVQDTRYRQAITAAATGCMAAIDAEHFIKEN
ncbi:MAG: thioredoxin-disulfide reductase [Bacteroidales bacterium]|nr:thioredoxin-disulfide reductase [Bacteroidales bacterium]